MGNQQDRLKGTMAIVLASLLWGTTGTAASYSAEVSPLGIGAFSMGIGGLLLLLCARKKLLGDVTRLIRRPQLFIFGALSVAIYPLAFYSAMHLSGVAIGTVVSIATAPLFAVLLEYLISKKKISRQWLLSFVVGALGILLLALGKDASPHETHNPLQQVLGILLGCIAGLTYASYSWVTRRLIETGVHAQSAMSALFGGAALLLLPSLYFTGDNLFSSATNSAVSLYMAIIPMFLGYLLFAFGLRFIAASQATLITLIEPLLATLLAVFILGERFQNIGWLGVCLVTLCLVLQTYTPRSKQRAMQGEP